MTDEDDVIAKLTEIPSVSEKCAKGLYLLGIRGPNDLKGKDPNDLYAELRERKDFFAEPCMLNMIKIAVGLANKGIENIARIK
ncbi:MAG: helix-hairpin-helix domain-containing protein [Methanomassiliicoccaceae archaeon]|nr:helix-hairpin-helix domain-containing protein [Methanomassiliicoccaceae archaeon]